MTAATPLLELQPVLMPATSRHAGQQADMTSRRSIRLRGDSEPPLAEHHEEAILDFFYHDGKFWTAKVALAAVQQIRGQAFNFSKIKTRKTADGPEPIRDERGVPKRTIRMLNHVQSRFLLDPDRPMQLFALGETDLSSPACEVFDFVYSLEAVGPTGVNFNFRDGVSGSLLSAHRFLSTQEMVFERIVVENQYVLETPAVPLSAPQRKQALVESLLRSHRSGCSEPYYLYRCCATNNCTSNPFQILDRVVDYKLRHRVGSLLFRLPLNPRWYLRVRGLDLDPNVKTLVRDEFGDFIGDKEVQKRKREYVRQQIRNRRAAR